MRARSGPDRVPLRSPADPGRPAKYSMSAEQFALLRDALLEAVAIGEGEVPLRAAVEHAQALLADHPAFPTGRVRHLATAAKGELQVRGELRVLDGPGAQVIARGGSGP
jgi:hypothetical protein